MGRNVISSRLVLFQGPIVWRCRDTAEISYKIGDILFAVQLFNSSYASDAETFHRRLSQLHFIGVSVGEVQHSR